jgi:hypothetical protein
MTATIAILTAVACCSSSAVCATVCNETADPMGVEWRLEVGEAGAPIARGALPLQPDECYTVSHVPQRAGRYEFVFMARGGGDVRAGVCDVGGLLPKSGGTDDGFCWGILLVVVGTLMVCVGVWAAGGRSLFMTRREYWVKRLSERLTRIRLETNEGVLFRLLSTIDDVTYVRVSSRGYSGWQATVRMCDGYRIEEYAKTEVLVIRHAARAVCGRLCERYIPSRAEERRNKVAVQVDTKIEL